MLDAEFVASQKDSRRLMVVLHGLGDSAAGFHWLPEALALPWLNYLHVNAPDPYYGGFSWYDYANDMTPGVLRSRQMLFELLDSHHATGYPTDQTTLFGFSQGCLMTIDIGLHYPRRFAGLVGISGYVYQPEQSLKELSPVARQQRFLVTHGVHDPIVPFDKSREQMHLLKAGGINLDWHEFQKPHTIAGEAELELIRQFVVAGYPPA